MAPSFCASRLILIDFRHKTRLSGVVDAHRAACVRRAAEFQVLKQAIAGAGWIIPPGSVGRNFSAVRSVFDPRVAADKNVAGRADGKRPGHVSAPPRSAIVIAKAKASFPLRQQAPDCNHSFFS